MSVPGIPTQLLAAIGAVLAWVNPNGTLPQGSQGFVVGALALVVAIVHAVQAYHRANVTPASTGSTPPPAAGRIGA